MNSPGSRSNWLSTALTDADAPGTTAAAWAFTSAVTCSRSLRRNGRTPMDDTGEPPRDGRVVRAMTEAATGAAHASTYLRGEAGFARRAHADALVAWKYPESFETAAWRPGYQTPKEPGSRPATAPDL